MKHLQRTVKAVVIKEEISGYRAECSGVPVMAHGNTLDKLVEDLREALLNYFRINDAGEMGFVDNPSVIILHEV